ncbi:hypothetical protein FPV67DRAFT_1477565 [Lyophyllum atratum]|nr:hypothetical protein FPV67DRAFT_1477565 [Lyophyllum atratum]
MPGIRLSAEICSRIVQSVGVGPKRGHGDLAALCRTCRAFQREAEVRLYHSLFFLDPDRAHSACRTLSHTPRLALFVHSFTLESRRPLTHSFWLGVKEALEQMSNLEILVLYDSTFANGWVLNSTDIKFQLHHAKLRFVWDVPLVRFLENQHKLQTLHTFDRMEDVERLPISPDSFPMLQSFDGTLMIGMQMLPSPLVYLQMMIDNDLLPHLMTLLPRLSKVHKTLRSLSLLDLPEELVGETLSIVSSVCPNLLALGLIQLPVIHRQEFHHSLMHMHHLKFIQLDVLGWAPHPNIPAQRALASEIRTYCPSVHHVVFWIGATRFRWHFVEEAYEWHSQVDAHQHPHYDTLWSHPWA